MFNPIFTIKIRILAENIIKKKNPIGIGIMYSSKLLTWKTFLCFSKSTGSPVIDVVTKKIVLYENQSSSRCK